MVIIRALKRLCRVAAAHQLIPDQYFGDYHEQSCGYTLGEDLPGSLLYACFIRRKLIFSPSDQSRTVQPCSVRY